MSSIPPPHPVRRRPYVAAPLAVLAIGVTVIACQPPAAADATGPDCTLTLAVEWDGTTVKRIDVTADYPQGVTPRYTVAVLGQDGGTLDYSTARTATYTRIPDIGGPASGVAVRDTWGYGCQAWDEPEPVEPDVAPPAYAPPAPEPGDHRDETTPAPAPTTEPAAPGSRVLHSL